MLIHSGKCRSECAVHWEMIESKHSSSQSLQAVGSQPRIVAFQNTVLTAVSYLSVSP
jgi:hypothetical protein